MTKMMKFVVLAVLALSAGACGDLDNGRSPSRVVISTLEGRLNLDGAVFGATLNSDVVTAGSVYNDLGQVTMTIILSDPGVAGLTGAPTALNQVTFTQYHVAYERTDGRSSQGVDIPYAFDGAVTFTVPESGSVTVPFEIVRHTAKAEAPLRALRSSGEIIATIATVTFYGKDQAGNNVKVEGKLTVNFGDFADPA